MVKLNFHQLWDAAVKVGSITRTHMTSGLTNVFGVGKAG